MRFAKEHETIVRIISTSILVLILGLLIYYWFGSREKGNEFDEANFTQLSDSWIMNDSEEISFPTKLHLSRNQILKLECTLPSDVNDSSAILYNAQYCVQHVYVDGKQVYSYAETSQLPFNSRHFGNIMVLINLKSEYAGKTLCIEMESTADFPETNFEGIFFGQAGDFKFTLLYRNLWRLLYAASFFSIAVIMFCIGVMHFKTEDARNYGFAFIYFSFLTSSVSTWLLADSELVQFVTSKTSIAQLLSMISLVCVAMFYMGLCRCMLKERVSLCMMLELLGYLLVLFTIVVYFLDIVNSMYIVFVNAFYMLACLLLSIYRIIRSWNLIYYVKIMGVGTIFLIIGLITGIVKMFVDPLGTDIAIALTTSFGGYLVLLFIIMMHYQYNIIKNSSASKIYERLAFTDQLTKIGNRAAFERTVDEIEENSDVQRVMLFMGDLNFLKKTNDNEGHEAGDLLIKSAAECFDEVFGKEIPPFRMGGDEFAAIVVDSEHDEKYYFDQINEAVERKGKEKKIHLSIAVSVAECDFMKEQKSIRHDLYREADAKMYDVKRQMKLNM